MQTYLYIYAQDGIKNFLDTLSKIEQDIKSGHLPMIAEAQLVFDSIRLSGYDPAGRPLLTFSPPGGRGFSGTPGLCMAIRHTQRPGYGRAA